MILYILATKAALEFKNKLQYCDFIGRQVSKKTNIIVMYKDSEEHILQNEGEIKSVEVVKFVEWRVGIKTQVRKLKDG